MMQIKQQIKSPLYRNSLFLIANTTVTAGLSFFFWVVVARLYTEHEVGLGAAIISAIYLLALFSRLGLDIALIRFLPKAEKPIDMINSCLTLSGIVVLAMVAIFLIGLGLWSPALSFIREDALFATTLFFFTLFWTLSGLMDHIFIARRRAEFVLSKNALFSLLKIPIPILLVIFFDTFGIVGSWGIAVGVALAISLFLFLPRVQNAYNLVPKLNLAIIKDIWRYSAGNYFAVLFISAPTFILPIMVVNLLGEAENAFFYVAWTIASFLFAIPLAVSQSLLAEGSYFEDEFGMNVRRSFKFVFLLLIPAIVLLLLLGKWLLLLFGATYSENALQLLWLLAISSIPIAVTYVYMSILRVRGQIRELMIITGFIALVVLLTSYFIAPSIGMIGIGYALIGGHGAISVYALFAMRSSYVKKRI